MLAMHAGATLLTAVALRFADRAIAVVGAALRRVLPRRLPALSPTARWPPGSTPGPAVSLRLARALVAAHGPARPSGGVLTLAPSPLPTPPEHPMSSVHSAGRALRAGVLFLVAGGALLAAATPAFAHVTAQPGQAEQGDYAVIALRVPTESDTAGTVKLQVTLPTDNPITLGAHHPARRAGPRPLTTVPLNPPVERYGRTITEAVNTVTWTAEPGTRIGPGEFADFPLSLGPLPEVGPAGAAGRADLRRRRGRRLGPAARRRTVPSRNGPHRRSP